jgi:Zn-dependent peptidase ImmA (M78 family)
MIRLPVQGTLDLVATSRHLGIRVIRRAMVSTLWGLTVDADTVLINSKLSGANGRFALAHEIAHVLARRGACSPGHIADEEAFADAFANELLAAPGARPRG